MTAAFLASPVVGIGSVLTQVIIAWNGVSADIEKLRLELVESLESSNAPTAARKRPMGGADRRRRARRMSA